MKTAGERSFGIRGDRDVEYRHNGDEGWTFRLFYQNAGGVYLQHFSFQRDATDNASNSQRQVHGLADAVLDELHNESPVQKANENAQ